MVALVFKRGGELIRSHGLLLALLTAWAFAPLVALVMYVAQHGGVLTGANGTDAFDQFQYLAWIRDEGSHLLASNLWQVGPTPHDYLQPMYAISGLLWQLGASIQVAYLVWKPVAVLVLFLGFAAYARHLLPGRGQQAAALVLGLFYLSPVLALAHWTGHISSPHRFALLLATDDADSALNLWGFEHTAIAIGLMPVFLIAVERVLAAHGESGARGEHVARGERALGARGPRPPAVPGARAWSALAAIAGLLVSWLHPWQGLMLLGVIAALALLKPPRRRYLALAPVALATVLPLLYGLVLSRADMAWHDFQTRTIGTGTAPWWALIASFGPLVALACLGARRPRSDRELMLALWLLWCAAVYFLVPEFPPHALCGVTLPLALLAVRGFGRIRAPARIALPLAIAGILAVTLPGAVYHAQQTRDDLSNTIAGATARQLLVLSPGQAAGLSYLRHARRKGAVLAPWLLSMSIPGATGRPAYAGHPMWQSAFNVPSASRFFDSKLSDPGGIARRAILSQSGAAFVLADCNAPATLASDIKPLVRAVRHFGCVTVYELS